MNSLSGFRNRLLWIFILVAVGLTGLGGLLSAQEGELSNVTFYVL